VVSILIGFLLAGDRASARTITVGPGGEFATVQAAIDAAAAGDEIIVQPGLYRESIRFNGIDIVVRGTAPTDPAAVAATILEAATTGSVVMFWGNETSSCVLAGFTIRGAHPPRYRPRRQPAGIDGRDGRPTIEHNVITSNTGYGVYRSHGPIRRNTVANNRGTGLAMCNGTIQSNTVVGNMGTFYVLAGGLTLCGGVVQDNVIAYNQGSGLTYCNGLIQRNTIVGNRARNNGGGLYSCWGTIRDNLIVGNEAPQFGGALYECCQIQGNTIVGNQAAEGGAAMNCRWNSEITNCIVWDNRSTSGGEVIQYSVAPSYSCIEDWTGGGAGNLAADPRFVDADGPDEDPATLDDNRYALAAGSPAIDAGTRLYWSDWPVRDLEGNDRLAGAAFDMGCYEFGGAPDADGDLLADAEEAALGTDANDVDTDGDGLVDGLEGLRGSDPKAVTPPTVVRVPADRPTIQEAIGLAVDGEEVIVAPGTYRGGLRMLGRNITLRSEDPANPATVAATVIEATNLASAIALDGTEGPQCVIAGFTLHGGDAGVRGGTASQHALAQVRQCTIEEFAWGIVHLDGLITSNTLRYNDEAIHNCDGLIQHNEITSNGAVNAETGALTRCDGLIQHNRITENAGGLVRCGGVIQNNVIARNGVPDGDGGALRKCDGLIRNNQIVENVALAGGGLVDCDGAIRQNLIAGNRARIGGGLDQCDGTIENNVVTSNVASTGGGLYRCNGRVANNTIVNNAADSVGGGLMNSTGTVVNCIVWGNRPSAIASSFTLPAVAFSDVEGWTGSGEDNIALDPLFVDADGPDNQAATYADNDFQLALDSPCVDAGDPATSQSDGCRPPGLGAARNDMGAYGGPHNRGWLGDDSGAPELPDLTGGLSRDDAIQAITGEPLPINATIINTGDVATTGAVWVEFYAIDPRTGWRDYLCDSVRLGPLGPGEIVQLCHLAPRDVYARLRDGRYRTEMRIDALDEVRESDEANNTAFLTDLPIASNRPDLQCLGAGLWGVGQETALDPEGGQAVTVWVRVENRGLQAARSGFVVELRAMPPGPLGGVRPPGFLLCDPIPIAEPLWPGDWNASSRWLVATRPLPVGDYLPVAVVDAQDVIAEQSEANLYVNPYQLIAVRSRLSGAGTWALYE